MNGKDSSEDQKRRLSIKGTEEERWAGVERRHLLLKPEKFVHLIKKIPIFNGFTPVQSMKILNICSRKTFSKNEKIYKTGEKSNNLLILLKGLLKVEFTDGRDLGRIRPIGFVGEMGVFTGEPRSADVSAMNESIALLIWKKELYRLFYDDSELGIKILTNVILDLSKKLRQNNAIIREIKKDHPVGDSTLIISQILESFEE